ncbi:MAG: ATPase, T2SS/T4P/T4SS family [Zoogloea sp.]|uniref:GspE/PulE family protein n=1 Tax=Zoogloea sp. TaxID=49181 RepID=UPI00262E70A5|nr:ATPase, T2SS/T4P/T4SS family [Zoogloea sp.]MDD2987849.1 ATPase, T2SS/T4P/T4SS family [Zoogloea sp.]
MSIQGGVMAVDSEVQSDRRIGQLLVAASKLSQRDLDHALAAQKQMTDLLGRVLVRLGVVSERDVADALVEQLGIPLVTSDAFPEEVVQVPGVSSDYFKAHRVLPLSCDGAVLRVMMGVPQDLFRRKALALASGLEVVPFLGLESEIEGALDRLYSAQDVEDPDAGDDEAFSGGQAGSEFVEHLKDLASEAPIIRLVNHAVSRVIDLRASDIHIEPYEDVLHIRYRVDGVLVQSEAHPPELAAAITSRIKLLAHLNIAERRLPQDGRIKTRVKGRELDLRVSTLPTVHGESVVMRVLDRSSIRLSLEDMGFSRDTLDGYKAMLDKPHGILLVTGPTGSGKTTTLYASLAKLDAVSMKILTVEDPVEYQLDRVNQVHVQPQIGLTFAHALRSILRQDPDIIMIGEMRDSETAQIAVQSALTGHLVLSTLHTNTAAGAIVRLEDMGVERYLITSSVNGVLAQRLVRTLCTSCRREVPVTEEVWVRSGLVRFAPEGERKLYSAPGCPACNHSGYRGRTSIHELFILDGDAHDAILSGADATTLHNVARKGGMLTLYEDGLRKVLQGVTSLEELMRATHDQINA